MVLNIFCLSIFSINMLVPFISAIQPDGLVVVKWAHLLFEFPRADLIPSSFFLLDAFINKIDGKSKAKNKNSPRFPTIGCILTNWGPFENPS